MFVFFDPTSRRVNHVITIAPEGYAEFLKENPLENEAWIEIEEEIPFLEIEVMKDLTVRRRVPMPLEYPTVVKVGEEFLIKNVPTGITISVNDAEMGVMDDSDVLEFTAGTGGFYRFKFEGTGYIPKEITIEAQV